jgi:hypothetical protein
MHMKLTLFAILATLAPNALVDTAQVHLVKRQQNPASSQQSTFTSTIFITASRVSSSSTASTSPRPTSQSANATHSHDCPTPTSSGDVSPDNTDDKPSSTAMPTPSPAPAPHPAPIYDPAPAPAPAPAPSPLAPQCIGAMSFDGPSDPCKGNITLSPNNTSPYGNVGGTSSFAYRLDFSSAISTAVFCALSLLLAL